MTRGQCRGQYGPEVDVWAVGCLVAELLTGRPAFPGANDVDQLQLVLECTGPLQHLFTSSSKNGDNGDAINAAPTVEVALPATLRPVKTRYAHLGKGVVSFLECCLEGNPENRLSPAQLSEHPWLTDHSHTWSTPEFLAARETERNALVHRRELVVRRQRMQLSTAQVLQLPPQSNCSSVSAAIPTNGLGAAAKPQSVYASSKLGVSAQNTAHETFKGFMSKQYHGSLASNLRSPTKFHPRRLATSTGVAVGSGSGPPLSKYTNTGVEASAVTSWRIPRSSNAISNASASTRVGDIHRNSNTSNTPPTTTSTSAAVSPLRASPYLTRGVRHNAGTSYSNGGAGITSATGILRPHIATKMTPSPTKRSARPPRSQVEIIATTGSTDAPASFNGAASAAGMESSGSGCSCSAHPSHRHIMFTQNPPQILQAPVSQALANQIASNQHDSNVSIQKATLTTLSVPAAAVAETPQQPKHRGFLSRLMHGSKREAKVTRKSPERGIKRSGLSGT